MPCIVIPSEVLTEACDETVLLHPMAKKGTEKGRAEQAGSSSGRANLESLHPRLDTPPRTRACCSLGSWSLLRQNPRVCPSEPHLLRVTLSELRISFLLGSCANIPHAVSQGAWPSTACNSSRVATQDKRASKTPRGLALARGLDASDWQFVRRGCEVVALQETMAHACGQAQASSAIGPCPRTDQLRPCRRRCGQRR
jgi:hypothetical protein